MSFRSLKVTDIDIRFGTQNFKNGLRDHDHAPFKGDICPNADIAYLYKIDDCSSGRSWDMIMSPKCKMVHVTFATPLPANL